MSFSLWSDEQEKPLRHIRVVDLTVMLPGPMVSRLLAQYGAEVVKVEGLPDGDPTRGLKQSALIDLLNQGKKSVAVNLKSPAGAEVVHRIASESDVFIENFREGVMDRLGLGYADLSEANPDLIYLSIRGFSGKNSVHAGHDLNFIATSGCGEWFLENGVPNYSSHFADLIGGAYVPALKLMFHLANPERRGMHLVAHMDESFRALYLPRAYDAARAHALPEKDREGFGAHAILDGSQPHSRYYQCRDGQWVALNAIQQKHWDTFCEVVDKAEWKSRMEDRSLCPEMEKLFGDAPASYWEALTATKEVCLFRVIPWAEHFQFTQFRSQMASDPLTWAGFGPNPSLSRPPLLGQDTFSVLTSLGVSMKDLTEWMGKGYIFQPPT